MEIEIKCEKNGKKLDFFFKATTILQVNFFVLVKSYSILPVCL